MRSESLRLSFFYAALIWIRFSFDLKFMLTENLLVLPRVTLNTYFLPIVTAFSPGVAGSGLLSLSLTGLWSSMF